MPGTKEFKWLVIASMSYSPVLLFLNLSRSLNVFLNSFKAIFTSLSILTPETSLTVAAPSVMYFSTILATSPHFSATIFPTLGKYVPSTNCMTLSGPSWFARNSYCSWGVIKDDFLSTFKGPPPVPTVVLDSSSEYSYFFPWRSRPVFAAFSWTLSMSEYWYKSESLSRRGAPKTLSEFIPPALKPLNIPPELKPFLKPIACASLSLLFWRVGSFLVWGVSIGTTKAPLPSSFVRTSSVPCPIKSTPFPSNDTGYPDWGPWMIPPFEASGSSLLFCLFLDILTWISSYSRESLPWILMISLLRFSSRSLSLASSFLSPSNSFDTGLASSSFTDLAAETESTFLSRTFFLSLTFKLSTASSNFSAFWGVILTFPFLSTLLPDCNSCWAADAVLSALLISPTSVVSARPEPSSYPTENGPVAPWEVIDVVVVLVYFLLESKPLPGIFPFTEAPVGLIFLISSIFFLSSFFPVSLVSSRAAIPFSLIFSSSFMSAISAFSSPSYSDSRSIGSFFFTSLPLRNKSGNPNIRPTLASARYEANPPPFSSLPCGIFLTKTLALVTFASSGILPPPKPFAALPRKFLNELILDSAASTAPCASFCTLTSELDVAIKLHPLC